MPSQYLTTHSKIVRMMRVLKGMPDYALNNDHVRRHAYEQAGLLYDVTEDEYAWLDAKAMVAEMVRAAIFRPEEGRVLGGSDA